MRLPILRLLLLHGSLVIGHWSFAATPTAPHPRLFLNVADVPAIRERAASPQGLRLVDSIRWMRDGNDPFNPNFGKTFGNNAALFLATGDRAYADLARDEFLFHVSRTDVWANPAFRSLTRGALTRGAAITYDICHPAWVGQTVPSSVTLRGETRPMPPELVGRDLNTVASRALLDSALALVKSGGKEWPGNTKLGNNWFAVRYGSALLALLACDEPADEQQAAFETSLRHFRTHLQTAYSTHPDANGWNPEGFGYTFYPAQFTYPAALALARLRDIHLADEIPALRSSFAALYHGLLALPTSHPGPLFGHHPDFTDDNSNWFGEGFANLAFAFAPREQHPALRHLYRRAFGDLGDARYDTSSAGGLWGLLFLDFDAPEQNPATVPSFGLNFADLHHGYFSFRKAYGEPAGEDILGQFMAKTVLTDGGHNAADGLGFRLWGLGVPWAVGSGRTTNPAGQNQVFAGEPDSARYSGQEYRLIDSYLRHSGGGYVVASSQPFSDVGVRDHVRRWIADYRPETGAEATWIISDTSSNGTHWRMNTIGLLEDGRPYNLITHDSASSTFTLENQFTGHRLVGHVLHPSRPAFRTGTFKRGSAMGVPLDLREPGAASLENAWIDFPSTDGAFVIALTLHRKGQTAPAVDSTVAADGARELRVGSATYTLSGDQVRVAGWERPRLSVTTPAPGTAFSGGEQTIALSGLASTASGQPVASIILSAPGLPDTTAHPSGETWHIQSPPLPLGHHTLLLRATDQAGEYTTQSLPVRITRSRAPEITLTSPTPGARLTADQALTFTGRTADPDGPLPATVELLDKDQKNLATASPATDGSFSLTLPANRFTPGTHHFTLRTVDSTEDATHLGPLPYVASQPFSEASPYSDLAAWTRAAEWRVTLEDDAGNLRYTILPSQGYKLRHALAYLPDRTLTGPFHLRLKLRLLTPESAFQVRLGRDAYLTLVGPAANPKGPAFLGFSASGERAIARLSLPALPDLLWHDLEILRTNDTLEVRRDGSSLVKITLKDDRSVEVLPADALAWDPVNGPNSRRGDALQRLWAAGPFGFGAPFADKTHLQLDDLVFTEPTSAE